MELQDTYIIFKNDLEQIGLWKKAASLFMGAEPPHRYKGAIANMGNTLTFLGIDTQEEKEVEIIINSDDIAQLYHGYDQVFNRWTVYGGGLWWAPIRLQFDSSTYYGENDLYLVTGFSGLNSSNKLFYEELKAWLS